MTLGSTRLYAEMSMRNLPAGKGRPARKADNFTVICESTILETCRPTACCRDSFTLYSLDASNVQKLPTAIRGFRFRLIKKVPPKRILNFRFPFNFLGFDTLPGSWR
jgi:hypothetical protein